MANNPGYSIRSIQQEDFFWLKNFDCSPLPIERDSIYLLFCVHFSATSFVALDSATDAPLGFVLGVLPAGRRVAYMHYLFVAEARRREGMAAALTSAFTDAARSLGATSATLFTRRATSFYASQGYQRRNEVFSDEVVEDRVSKGAQIMTIDL